MRLFIHALGASAGGGLTYLRNLLPQLALRPDVTATVLAGHAVGEAVPAAGNIEVLPTRHGHRGAFSRFLWEQREIPRLIRESRANVLLSTGNFAIWNSPVPQILLSRNSLYTSADFSRDLRARREYGMWADTRFKAELARRSISRASLTLAPSEAFARELREWSGQAVEFLHHGFDRDSFIQETQPFASELAAKLRATEGATRLLFVSHYNYYRNFETLFRALALVKQRQPSLNLRLLLTCDLSPGKNPGAYRTESASALLRALRIEDDVVQLGTVPYRQLHHLYRACDVYVTPAYTETFAHPLVEAMACGLPVVASDLPVHKEITGGAALFFERFSPAALAEKVVQLSGNSDLRADLRDRGFAQSAKFSWNTHAERLLELAGTLIRGRKSTASL